MSNVKMPEPEVSLYVQCANGMQIPVKAYGKAQVEAYARAVRDEALEEAILLIESIEFPVGNSAAGELAADWTLKTLSEARHAIRALKEQS